MAWSKSTANGKGVYTETSTLPSSATTEYCTEINFIKVRDHKRNVSDLNQYVTFALKASAVTGTNLDIALYGANSSGGTKFLLKDAVVADITDATKAAGIIDVKAYPAPYYYIAWTADANESANTITLEVSGDLK